MPLVKVISGGQSGADIAGVRAGKKSGHEVGGTMPNGFRTLDGPKPEYAVEYNMKEHSSAAYPPRTYQNAKDSDATLRFAHNFASSGEKCTMKAIVQYKKPHFDVLVKDPNTFSVEDIQHPKMVAAWLHEQRIQILNVAGNSEQTCPGIEAWVERFMTAVFAELVILEGGDKS